MSAAIILGVYVIGWVVAASMAMRVMADRVDECGNAYTYGCIHLGPHWRGDGTIGGQEVQMGALVAIAWPILWLPVVAYLLAARRPTARALENHIAALEKEAGIR